MIKDQTKGTVALPNYGKLTFKERLIKRLRNSFAKSIDNTPLQFKAYLSYWHFYFSKKIKSDTDSEKGRDNFYLTQKPDYGAGIGHQLANWNSGFYFAKTFNIKFAHTQFSSPKWESFLGFGGNEILSKDLIGSSEYKKIRLPRFDSNNPEHMELIQSIINSYADKKVLFMFEINQGYPAQCDTYKELSDKFFSANSRKDDNLIFKENSYNIAIHIRRRMKVESDDVWADRGLDNVYFYNVLTSALFALKTNKDINIYFFSQGTEADFPEFKSFTNFHYCMDMNPYDSFLHMVNADLLISSKSSFSYKPALISKGVKICPETFWHSFPDSADYILANNKGEFDLKKLSSLNVELI